MTYIDIQHGWYSEYKGESVGRVMHYVHQICGLQYAEKIKFHGDGVIKYYNEPFATYKYVNGDPYLNFKNKDFNIIQDKLLAKEYKE